MRTMVAALVLLAGIAAAQEQPPAPPAPKTPTAPAAPQASQSPTEISADLGTCSALFHVTDLAGHPLYNAKVHVLIRYGFMSKRKTELTAGTNADGKVKFIRLPNEIKKPLIFDVTYGELLATLTMDPATRCQAQFTVPFKVPK